MARPALQRLLNEVQKRRIGIVAVYKVDRLDPFAPRHFAKIVDIFDEAGISFVSVTQAFNTTSSMGRLTLNMLLSFAQFEREQNRRAHHWRQDRRLQGQGDMDGRGPAAWLAMTAKLVP